MIKRLLVHLSLYGRISRFVGPYATSFLRGVTRAPAGADGVHVNTGDDVALMISAAAAAAAAVGTARQSLGETVVERSRLSNDGRRRRRRRCCSINNSTTTKSADSAALVHPARPGRLRLTLTSCVAEERLIIHRAAARPLARPPPALLAPRNEFGRFFRRRNALGAG